MIFFLQSSWLNLGCIFVMECRILECVCGAFVRETGVLCASERLGMKMAGIYIMYGAVFGVRFPVIFYMFCLHAKTHMAYRKKYKPYILKYKALILKYVPYIFREKRHLIFNDLQNRKNSVFPHRCARKKIIRNGMYTSPQTVHRFRRADGFYTHAACVSKAPECRCKNTV